LRRKQQRDVGNCVHVQQHSLNPDERGVVSQLLCAHLRGIFSTYVLEAYCVALLDWLEAFEERKLHRCSGHSYFFMSCYDGNQLVNLVQVSFGEFGVPLWPHDRGFAGFFRKLGGMVLNVELMVLLSKNIGGEFVGKVPIAGLLSKLDAGAHYNGWIFRGGLRLYSEKEAEKIPVGFNSKESFAKMDEDGNMAN
jgi:hypothetical protein